jgi:hypothetical protein
MPFEIVSEPSLAKPGSRARYLLQGQARSRIASIVHERRSRGQVRYQTNDPAATISRPSIGDDASRAGSLTTISARWNHTVWQDDVGTSHQANRRGSLENHGHQVPQPLAGGYLDPFQSQRVQFTKYMRDAIINCESSLPTSKI